MLKHHRRSIRMPGVDYTGPGAYFITLCAEEHECLFGAVVETQMRLNTFGEIIAQEWERTAVLRANVVLDAFVVTPNHVHGILIITANGEPAPDIYNVHGKGRLYVPAIHNNIVGASRRLAPTHDPGERNRPRGAAPNSLGAMVGLLKSAVTKRINAVRETPGAPVWQRNYHEHIIRNGRDLDRIRRYIAENPARWRDDRYHRTR